MLNGNIGARALPRRLVMPALFGAALLAAPAAWASDWYVDGLNGNDRAAGTVTAPFKDVWYGLQRAQPGDTVWLLPTTTYAHVSISRSGTNLKRITLAGAGVYPNLTKVRGDVGNFAVWVDANYVTVRNLDISAPGTRSALHVAENFHHVTIANNVAHDSGGNGISTVGDDYITISHNIVYGNAKNTSDGAFGSGISTLGNIDIDGNTGVKVRIDGNVVYANTNTPNCSNPACLLTATDSDGNGIIIDDLRRTQRDNIPYNGRTLITNNVVFGNGGRGIHVYRSDHVTITNNTAYFNNRDPYEGNYHPGEIGVIYSGDVSVTNNIAYSDGGVGELNGKYTGTHVPLQASNNSGGGPIVLRTNLCDAATGAQVPFYGKANAVPVSVGDNLWGDPRFASASLDPSKAVFYVLPGSPALGAANLATTTDVDILGLSRAGSTAIGAYTSSSLGLQQMLARR